MILNVLETSFMIFVAAETGLKFEDFSGLPWDTARSWQHAWWVGTRGFLALASKTITWWVGTQRFLALASKTIEAET